MGFYFNIFTDSSDLRFVYASNADRANNYANLSEPVSSSFDLDIYSLLDHAAQLSGVSTCVKTGFEICNS